MRWPQIQPPEWLGRLPVVSAGLVVLWLATTLVVEIGFSSRAAEARRGIAEAVRLAIENPVLEVPPRLLPAIRALMPTFESNETFAFLRDGGEGGAALQEQFDARVAGAFETLDSHPHRVLGVVPARLEPHTFATHTFVHAGALHVLATALLWLLCAPLLERVWGRRVFAGTLLLAGLGSGAVFALVHAGADRALVGASALVSAAVASVVVRFRTQEVDLLGWLDGLLDAELSVPAWMLAPLWLAYEAALWWAVPGALHPGLDDAVGYTAHAAGAVLGGVATLAIAKLGWEERFGRPGVAATPRTAGQRFDFQRVLALRASGESERAYALLEAELARSARHRDAVTTFWEMSIERGEPGRAVEPMKKLIREELRRGAEEIAVAQWRELTEHLASERLEVSTLLRLVPCIRRLEGEESAAIALQQILDAGDAAGGPGLARAARLAEDTAPELALAAARRALEAGGLPEGPRLELEELAARLSRAAGDSGPVEEEKPEVAAATPPPNVFYDESDRSAFGAVDDLSALDDRFPEGAVLGALPHGLGPDGAQLRVEGQGDLVLAWSRLRGVAAAGVHGLGPKPIVLVDLLVDGAGSEKPLRVLRLRSDQFSPRRLFPEAGGGLHALRQLVAALLERAGARPLPDAEALRLDPVRMYQSLDEYHAQVLRPAAVDWV